MEKKFVSKKASLISCVCNISGVIGIKSNYMNCLNILPNPKGGYELAQHKLPVTLTLPEVLTHQSTFTKNSVESQNNEEILSLYKLL